MKPQQPPPQKKGSPEKVSLSKKNLEPFLSPGNKWLIIIGLIVYVFVLYGNSIGHDYALDDDIVVRKNRFVHDGISGIPDIFAHGYLYGFNRISGETYRPFTLVTLAIEEQLWPDDPHANHFFNVLWYGVTVVFLFLLLLKLFRKYHFIVPLLITLLFAAHPIHTEAIANIKSRDEILGLLGCVLSLYFGLSYYSYGKSVKWLVASVVFFFIAILSKENVIMFVAITPLVYYFFTEFPLKKIILITIPYAAVVVVLLLIRIPVLRGTMPDEKMSVVNNLLMAAPTTAQHYATAVFILGKYIALLFFPYPLSWDYSYNQIPIIGWADIKAILSIAAYLFLFVYAIIGFKKKDVVSFGILYFLLSMVVISNIFFNIGASIGERFLYTPSLGFCIIVVIVLLRLLKVDMTSYKLSKLTTVYAVFGVILLAYSVKTIARNTVWENNLALFNSGVITAPKSARAHESLANELMEDGVSASDPGVKGNLFSRAKAEFDTTLNILPQYPEALYNEGYLFLQMNNDSASKQAFRQCIAVDSTYAAAYNNLGTIYFNEKRYDMALPYFEKSIKEDSTYGDPYGNIGACYHNMGQLEKAIPYYEKALRLNPTLDNVKQNLIKAQNQMAQKKQ